MTVVVQERGWVFTSPQARLLNFLYDFVDCLQLKNLLTFNKFHTHFYSITIVLTWDSYENKVCCVRFRLILFQHITHRSD